MTSISLSLVACLDQDPAVGTAEQSIECSKYVWCSDLRLVDYDLGGYCPWVNPTNEFRLYYENAGKNNVATYATSRRTYVVGGSQQNFDATLAAGEVRYLSVGPSNGIVNGVPNPMYVTLELDYLDLEAENNESNNSLTVTCSY